MWQHCDIAAEGALTLLYLIACRGTRCRAPNRSLQATQPLLHSNGSMTTIFPNLLRARTSGCTLRAARARPSGCTLSAAVAAEASPRLHPRHHPAACTAALSPVDRGGFLGREEKLGHISPRHVLIGLQHDKEAGCQQVRIGNRGSATEAAPGVRAQGGAT